MKIIALANQKGGVGKSTTAVSLGIGLVREGKKVLLVDGDAQGNLTQMLGWQPDELEVTLSTMLEKVMVDHPIQPKEGILQHPEGVELMPANIDLSATEVSMMTQLSRETLLKRYLQTVEQEYDYILIDCMPSLGMMTINALAAADRVIIPVQAQYLPAKGLEQLLRSVFRMKRQLNQGLEIMGILVTMVDRRTRLSKDMSSILRKTYGDMVLGTEIPFATRVAEMSASSQSIYEYDPTGKAAEAYQRLAKEVLLRE